jgi:hypothetical protein
MHLDGKLVDQCMYLKMKWAQKGGAGGKRRAALQHAYTAGFGTLDTYTNMTTLCHPGCYVTMQGEEGG